MNTILDTTGLSLWELIEARAEASPDKLMALDETGRTITFAGYRQACLEAAAGLGGWGISAGDRVSWILPSRFESFTLAGALSRLGATQVPILPIYRHREVGFILEQAEATSLVVPGVYRDFDFAAMANEIAEGTNTRVLVADPDLPTTTDTSGLAPYQPGADQVRWIFYSSGTTADPKGAKHSDSTISAANDGMQWGCKVGPDDVSAVVFPITHVGGLVWLFNSMQTGVKLLITEAFNPAVTPRWLSDNGCTCAGAGTVFFQTYLRAEAANAADGGDRLLPDVRIFNGGGAPKPPSLHGELVNVFGAPLLNGWGLTESPINTMANTEDPDDMLAETEGRAVPGTEIRVVLDGADLGPGAEGELWVKGPQVCHGYLDSDLDKEAFVDGWFRTGDLGVVDEKGFVQITGRLKDIIIRKGENISSKEIEDLLHTHPKVADVAVIGLPDEISGERACAVVVTAGDDPLTFEELGDYCSAAALSKHKTPEQLEIVEALPRNPTGKILKKDLRASFY